MSFMRDYLKIRARDLHRLLLPAIGLGMPANHAMTGILAVVSNTNHLTVELTANYAGPQHSHVEVDLLGQLHTFCGGFNLPPGTARVYLYVYDSPCQACHTHLNNIRQTWIAANPHVEFKLGFTQYYLQPSPPGWATQTAADVGYAQLPWTWKQY